MVSEERSSQGQPRQQQIQIRLDESRMTTTYANTIRSTTTADEVVLDFGLNLPMQGGPNESPAINFAVGSRVVLNWTGAKRLALTLQQIISAYEQHHGPIELAPPPRPRSNS